MDSHHRHLGRGFNWLGSATIVARLIDFATILIVLLFLTKEQVGVASLIISLGMVIEAFNGFGTGQALVQAQSVSRLQLDTLFWFVVGAALCVAVLTVLVAPGIGAIYGVAGMTAYFAAVAAKQPIVGAALIPLSLLNRDLQYERIAIVNVAATLAAALTRLGLAVLGAGTWALIAGYTANGFYMLIGAWIAKPFWPSFRFRMAEISPLVRFGFRAVTSNVFEQLFKNVDYLLIGWFYGTSALAVYRVAFDVAMEPAMAAGTLVTRVALPVFARVAAIKHQLSQALAWSLQRLVTLILPLMAGLILVADPLMSLIHDRQGHSYAAAALPLKLLAAAAFMRAIMQLLYPVMIGSGRPGMAARLSAVTLLLLTIGILVAGVSFPAETGIVAVSAVWLGIYPFLLIWGARYLRRSWDIRAADLLRTFAVPSIAIAAMVAVVQASRVLIGTSDPKIHVGLILAALALTYSGLYLYASVRPQASA